MRENLSHQPVLLQEAIQALNIQSEGVYLDGTFGCGGHTEAILNLLNSKGRIIALDRDPQAAVFAKMHFGNDQRFCFIQKNFARLAEVLECYHLLGCVQGILLDIGMSSPQLDNPDRGFSFRHDGPLDMRMDPTHGVSAAEWLAKVSEKELAQVLKKLGEERFSRRIANTIVMTRKVMEINRTRQLADIVASVIPVHEAGQHPATRSFQAIRIHINNELEALQSALDQTLRALAPGGRLVVISFHSLEDRLVKRFMRRHSQGTAIPPEVPVTAAQSDATLRIIGKSLQPGSLEIRHNPRARSARMRVAERLA
jgi:16S rRNA (cytosine1402-N4)-methyltransferase